MTKGFPCHTRPKTVSARLDLLTVNLHDQHFSFFFSFVRTQFHRTITAAYNKFIPIVDLLSDENNRGHWFPCLASYCSQSCSLRLYVNVQIIWKCQLKPCNQVKFMGIFAINIKGLSSQLLCSVYKRWCNDLS